MAAPTFVQTSTGATDAGGAWFFTPSSSVARGNIVIAHILQDGSTSGAVARTGQTFVTDLAGASGWTFIGEFAVGNPTAALQHLWIGRASTTAQPAGISGTNSTSEDLYMNVYEFADCSAGTTLATVIENSTAGSTANGVGTSNTASDTAVTTLSVDRLALNFLGINDDNPFAGFTGQSGGTWVTRSSYADASGTDGAIYLTSAAMASAGTIDGGTGSITDIDSWGVVGFALIGTTPATLVPRSPGIDSGNAHFSKAWHAIRKWRHGTHGILVPDLQFSH